MPHVSVGDDEVKRIARLARLRFSEEEAEALGRDLNGILAYVDALESVSVDEASFQDSTGIAAPERAPGDYRPDALIYPPGHDAPDFRDGFFVVPSPPALGTDGDPANAHE